MKKHILMPNDVKNKTVLNICSKLQTPAADVIEMLVKKTINQLHKHHTLPKRMYRVELAEESSIPKVSGLKLELSKFTTPAGVKDLMLAVIANRTIKYFERFYYYRQHQKRVDKDHIDECSYTKGKVPNTLYNDQLN